MIISKLTSILARPAVAATAATVVLVAVPIAVVGTHSHHDGGFRPAASSTPLVTASTTTVATPAAPTPTVTDTPTGTVTSSVPPLPPPPGGTPITWVQANVKDGMAAGKTAADVATVYSEQPDFISFNEVEYRGDAVLDPYPAEYGIWRTPGQYTGETPILWNTTKWTEIAEGTTMLSHVTTIPKGKKSEWGMRYANWVTVVNAAGQKMSAISAHLAPQNPAYGNLIPIELTRLSALVQQLEASGPVVVGGDFNTNYDTTKAPAYPRAQLATIPLTPTYDILGQKLATGDEHGATIDYVFVNNPLDFSVLDQHTDELNSDHKAVVEHLQLLTPGISPSSRVFTRGRTSGTSIQSLVANVIKDAPAGATVHLATHSLRGPYLGIIKAARKRDVGVQLIVGDTTLTSAEKSLRSLLGNNVSAASFFRRVPRQFTGRGHLLPPTMVLASQTGATQALRIRISKPLVPGQLKTAVANSTTGQTAYNQFFDLFMRAVGRTV